jgi:hypothetical protein
MKLQIVHGLVCLLLLVPASDAFAADDLRPRFEVRLGGLVTDFSSDLRINDSDGLRGSGIDLERDLDIEDALEAFRMDLRWRFRQKHAIDFAYYDISRSGRRVIDRTLEIGDQTFPIGTNLSSTMNFEVFKLAYAYSFSQSEKSEASVSLGVHAIDVGFRAKGRLLGIPVDRQTSEVVLPLPVLGFQYSRYLGGPFTLNADVDLFAIEYGDYKGSLWDANLTLDMAFTDQIGGFLGYNFVDMGVESDDEDLLGKLDYQYGALTLGVRLTF